MDRDGQQELWPRNRPQTRPPRRAFASLAPAVPSEVYDAYWRFAAERQAIFFRRVRGESPPWTGDPILRTYKFTNVYRASDRVSQYLIRRVIYDGPREPDEVFFRTILFKLFNKIETWETLGRAVGEPTYGGFSVEAYDRVLAAERGRGRSIYSAAYIMPSGSRGKGRVRKHRMHLELLERMMEDEVPARIAGARTMREAFELLLSYPTIGGFLAYQFVTDLNYSELCDFSESEFVVPGPGAADGISKCFISLGGLSGTDVVKLVADRQEMEFERLGLGFETLWGRRLQLIDCQNIFCEVSKYSRVSHPHVTGAAGRTRIKQKFTPAGPTPPPWFPPKWGLNEHIQDELIHIATGCDDAGQSTAAMRSTARDSTGRKEV